MRKYGLQKYQLRKAGIIKYNIRRVGSSRWALNFDGVGVRAQTAARAINPDGDFDIEFYIPATITSFPAHKTIISQNISSDTTSSEFCLFLSSTTGNLGLTLGGVTKAIGLAAELVASEKMRLTVIGTTARLYRANAALPIRTTVDARGAVREPTAQTVIGARTNGAIGTFNQYFNGVQRDLKINGTLWPMADRNQAIQLPEPSGLGAELLANPTISSNGSGWGKDNITAQSLGANLFKLTNTINSYAGAIFQTIPTIIGEKYVIRFKVSFQTVSTNFRVSINSTTAAQYTGDLLAANYTASEQYLFVIFTATTTSATIRLLCNSSNAGSYVEVSELTVKPLGTCNPMTISNATSANWVEVPV